MSICTAAHRTAHHPSAAVVQHIVALARTAMQQLTQLLLLGSNASVAQQQLHILQQRICRKELAATVNNTGADAAAQVEQQQQQQRLHQEMTALATAWRAAAGPNLSGFDVWILLRKESLPFADRSDMFAAQQLEALLKQQQKRRLQLMGPVEGGSSSSSKSGKRRNGLEAAQIGNGHGDNRGDDGKADGGVEVLGRLLSSFGQQSGVKVQAPKTSRAVLRDIPEQVCGANSYEP